MKGVITDYFEDRGFGFIRDENQENRFFHINNVKDKKKLLDNLSDYFFSDYNDQYAYDCFLVEFTPGNNEKGLDAKRIELLDERFLDNDKDGDFPSIITGLEYDVHTLTRLVKGVKKGQKPFALEKITAGGNGTYRIGYPEVTRQLFLDYRRSDRIGWGSIDVRDQALAVNNRSQITNKFVRQLKDKLLDNKVVMRCENGEFKLADPSILKV